jgi:hypothetical protein
VEAVLTPITDKVFYTFYDQGYPADLVARTMLDSVQHVTTISTNIITTNIPNSVLGLITNVIAISTTTITTTSVTNNVTNNVTTITTTSVTNSIPASTSTNIPINITNVAINYEFWVNDPNDPSYPQFLEFCSQLRYAQLCHALTVGTAISNALIYSSTNAKLTDVVAAVQAGLSVKCDSTNNGHIAVTQSPSIKFVGPGELYRERYEYLTNELKKPADTNITFDNQDPGLDVANAVHLAQEFTSGNYTLKMRTFEAAMYSVAKQEVYFRHFAPTNHFDTNSLEHDTPPYTTNITYTKDGYGPLAIVTHQIIGTPRTIFSVREIKDLNEIIQKWSGQSNAISAFMWQSLSNEWRPYLTNYPPSASNSIVQDIVLQALNETIGGANIYESNRFHGISLSPETTNLLKQAPTTGPSLAHLNRLLLEDAYKNELLHDTDFKHTQFQIRPTMTLTYPILTNPLYSKLANVSYGDDTYWVGDPKDSTQNRTVFTMLSYLFSQTAISTQSLPVQQLIQVQ